MPIEFTPEQQKVLDARNHNILVSAAAGSGKTAVLVERIVRLVSEGEHPLDIDRLLVVTFTRAAAAQMRERIGRALSERLSRDPENRHLQRQEVLLHNAQITTMDSFFTFLLRNYFSDIDLDPGFRQIEPEESELIAADVLQAFLEEKYAQKDPSFLSCVSYFCPGTGDGEMEKLIRELCKQAGSHPSPSAWLTERAADYDVQDEEALFKAPWMRSAVIRAAERLLESERQYRAMEELCLQPGGPDAVFDFLEQERRDLFAPLLSLTAPQKEEGEERIGEKKWQSASNGFFREIWDEVQRTLRHSFARYPGLRGKKYDHIDPDKRAAVKSMRDAEKDQFLKLREAFGGQSPEVILTMMKAAKEPVQTLSSLAQEYSERFFQAKQEKHMIDFVDLEHLALDILAERLEDGSYRPRRAAKSLRSHYEEILIDEYQDSNEVQELLLQIISGEDEGRYNRFMVGDVKQSIYRFRLARPEIFMEKYGAYRPDDPETERIELDRNFRSRPEVLDCVNMLFGRIMRKEVGGVEYSREVSLKQGAAFPEAFPGEKGAGEGSSGGRNAYRAELLLLDLNSGEGEEEDDADQVPEELGASLSDEISSLTDRQKEALLIAGRIRSMVGSLPVRDHDTGEMRPARYGDIVILLRSTVGWNEDLRAVFEREGIPAYAESRTGYFAAGEIREVLGFLRVLDNPRQDIPLYGVLHGFFGGFSEEEITQIRLDCPQGQLFDALSAAAEERSPDNESSEDSPRSGEEGVLLSSTLRKKCREFLSMVRKWRSRVRYSTVSEVVSGILDETGFQDYCTALPGGDQRVANLLLLRGQADAFTKTDFTGLFQFLRYIDGLGKQEIDYGEANTLDENADVVRIMSIHKSKGLEFPICIVAGLSKRFSFRHFDASGPMLIDGDWGVGVKYYNSVTRLRSSTLRREEIAEKIRRDCMGEELRVLYVAMTRAEEKLIMTASSGNFEKKRRAWQERMAGFLYSISKEGHAVDFEAAKLSPAMIGGASCFAELICEAVSAASGPNLMSGEELPLRIDLFSEEDLAFQVTEEQLDLSHREEALRDLEGRPLSMQPDAAVAASISERYFRVYPHEELRGLCAHTSVSELKHRGMLAALRAKAMSAKDLEGSGGQTPSGAGMPEGPRELFPEVPPVPYLPAFLSEDLQCPQDEGEDLNNYGSREDTERREDKGKKDASAGGARAGTAFHRIMELMAYERREEFLGSVSEKGSDPLHEWIRSLVDSGRISAEEASLVETDRVKRFLETPLARRMAAAQVDHRLFREQPFLMGCPADMIESVDAVLHESDSPVSSEMVTVQGIIDAFFFEESRIVLVDYKTDRVQTGEQLCDRYRTQLEFYAKALEKAFSMPVMEKILYSTSLGKEIIL